MTSSLSNNVSVVVATRHDTAEVERRIGTMLPRGVELIVVGDKGVGVSQARNRGINLAHKEWILMMDDDDVIHPTAFDIVDRRLQELQPTLPSIIEWGYNIVDGHNVQAVHLTDNPMLLTGEEVVEAMVENIRFTSNLWNKLIHRSLIADTRFNPGISYGEDWDFLWRIVSSNVDEVSLLIIPDKLYDYVQHPGQVSAGFSKVKLDLIPAWGEMLNDVARHYPSLYAEARATYGSHLTVVLYAALKAKASRSATKTLRHSLRHQLVQLWQSPRHSLKKKLAATWLSI